MLLLFMIAVTAFCATFAGGIFAFRLKDKLHLVLGFSAGAVIGVAFFELLPEALQIGKKYQTPETIVTWGAVGFLTYLLLDRVILHYGQRAYQSGPTVTRTPKRGALGAGSLSAHSFLDGIAIGLAFQASTAIGAIVTIGVLTHDFSDGINTMNVILKNGGSRRQAFFWLSADAVTPSLGILLTLFFVIPERFFGVILAVFFGFFLYIGASDFIPESHHTHPKFLTTAMTILGAAVIYLAVFIARH
jgi:ZIP family zinc transporter